MKTNPLTFTKTNTKRKEELAITTSWIESKDTTTVINLTSDVCGFEIHLSKTETLELINVLSEVLLK